MNQFLHAGGGATRIPQINSGLNDRSWLEVRIDINVLNIPDIICSETDMSAVDIE